MNRRTCCGATPSGVFHPSPRSGKGGSRDSASRVGCTFHESKPHPARYARLPPPAGGGISACASRVSLIINSVVRERASHPDLRTCLIAPGMFAAPGRRLVFPLPDKVRGMERRVALGAFAPTGLARPGTRCRGVSHPGEDAASRRSTLRHFAIPGRAFRDGCPSRSASSWQADPSVHRAEPRAAPVQGYEPCAEEAAPHPARMTSHETPSVGWDTEDIILLEEYCQ